MNRIAMENKKLAQDERQHKRENRTKREIAAKELSEKQRQANLNVGTSLLGTATKGLVSVLNSPEWYKGFIPDLSQFTNLPTYNMLGGAVRANPLVRTSAYSGTDTYSAEPGVMAITYAPTIGRQVMSNLSGSAITIALENFMAQMRKLNSRVGEYDPPEVGLYFLAASDIVSAIMTCETILKAAVTYDGWNRYVGDALIRAKLGTLNDTSFATILADIRTNRAIYVGQVNELVTRFNSAIAVPAKLGLIQRRAWMASLVLGDSTHKKKQLYVFEQMGYWKFNGATNELLFNGSMETASSFQSILTMIRNMIEELVNTPIMITLAADLRSAFPEGELAKIPYMTTTDTVEIGVSDEVLSQLHNLRTPATAASLGSNPNAFNVGVSTSGYLYQGSQSSGISATLSASAATYATNLENENIPLSLYKDDITGDDVIVATRLRPTSTITGTTWTLDAVGTELPLGLQIYSYIGATSGATPSSLKQYTLYTDEYITFDPGTPSTNNFINAWNKIQLIALASKFDWCPLIRCSWRAPTDDTTERFISGEIGNYFDVSHDNYMVLHDACVKGELFIPSSGFKS